MDDRISKFWDSLTSAQRIIIYTLYATLNMTYGPVTAEQKECFLKDLITRSESIGHLKYYQLSSGLAYHLDEILIENPKAKFEEVVRSLIPDSNVVKP